MCPYDLKVFVVSVWNGDSYCSTDLARPLFNNDNRDGLAVALDATVKADTLYFVPVVGRLKYTGYLLVLGLRWVVGLLKYTGYLLEFVLHDTLFRVGWKNGS
jgi:hypothetical protein